MDGHQKYYNAFTVSMQEKQPTNQGFLKVEQGIGKKDLLG